MKVKVCGMKDAENIKEIASLKPNYLGFIFYELSPRNCIGIDPHIIESLPDGVEPVMVAVDMTEDEVLITAGRYGFHTVQLHGKESPQMCRQIRKAGIKVMKAIGMHSAESMDLLKDYEGSIDLFLLDTFTPSKGGSGKKFDWSILNAYNLNEPFMLSGGIGPEDAEAILNLHHPKFEGIDLNSRFESYPGHKNSILLQHFLSMLSTQTLNKL